MEGITADRLAALERALNEHRAHTVILCNIYHVPWSIMSWLATESRFITHLDLSGSRTNWASSYNLTSVLKGRNPIRTLMLRDIGLPPFVYGLEPTKTADGLLDTLVSMPTLRYLDLSDNHGGICGDLYKGFMVRIENVRTLVIKHTIYGLGEKTYDRTDWPEIWFGDNVSVLSLDVRWDDWSCKAFRRDWITDLCRLRWAARGLSWLPLPADVQGRILYLLAPDVPVSKGPYAGLTWWPRAWHIARQAREWAGTPVSRSEWLRSLASLV